MYIKIKKKGYLQILVNFFWPIRIYLYHPIILYMLTILLFHSFDLRYNNIMYIYVGIKRVVLKFACFYAKSYRDFLYLNIYIYILRRIQSCIKGRMRSLLTFSFLEFILSLEWDCKEFSFLIFNWKADTTGFPRVPYFSFNSQ